jgi:hypothetical protein
MDDTASQEERVGCPCSVSFGGETQFSYAGRALSTRWLNLADKITKADILRAMETGRATYAIPEGGSGG